MARLGTIQLNTQLSAVEPDPPAEHDDCIFIRPGGDSKNLVGGSITSLQEVTVRPLDVVIQEDVSHQTLEFIGRKKSTRTVDEVNAPFREAPTKMERNLQE